jgi:predicted secreted protein
MAGTFANGAVFKIGTTTVSELTSIKPPSFESDDIDVTTHTNTTKFKEYIKGLTDAGEVSIEGNMNYTDYGTVYASAVTTTLQSITITLPTSPSVTTFTCNGYVKGLECEAPVDDKISYSATVKITGKPTLTAT